MVMHYHWALGIGHLYSHGRTANIATIVAQNSDSIIHAELETEAYVVPHHLDENNSEVGNDPELCFDCRQDYDLGEWEEGSELGTGSDDEFLVAMDDMYGNI
jgi:hypothetical protein